MIPYGKHTVGEADIAAVVEVLQHQFLTQGEQVPKFEQMLQAYCQVKYALAVNSGTSALHVACLALGVGEGDIVWTSPISFVASANCALYCGADIDFVDIDPATRNLCIEQLQQKLQRALKHNRLPKAIVVVHYAGLSCDMAAIRTLTQRYDIALIEDASHALGGSYCNAAVGSCQYSDITVTSFHPVKSITTAEGGALLTNDNALYEQAVLFAKHGVTRDPAKMSGHNHGPWYYQQVELGYNYRMSDLHAALGCSQLSQLDDFISARRNIARYYLNALAELPLHLPAASDTSAWHLFAVELTQHCRHDVYRKLQQAGIGVNVHYIPIHLQPYYQKLGFKKGYFPKAEAFYESALTLPMYPGLQPEEQSKVIEQLSNILNT
ncbi:UDP-4-amino-4,6-dideoxy-N-acetyl-beta-L-altrosamine transaminase [Salinimonas marina]|uniref:UDP-4-amino-4, 6-dideoxy-N-acetyl-beta-L-altrosamine transaminase n=1 Tax=Salinimonas marina TaxID=2785918 RepID=A0A7S9DVY0_9ALTE|nr:UDP-4-amino-4,6-dideoxy-N-acetyl-beta-L-altrosamine transaminase [Salinimonas marina]QPG04959.1 UDP-4-amino-4,6-dideoxy-N-acetyl-beta-L-altrosamine transaminase [Salinimonas marina]